MKTPIIRLSKIVINIYSKILYGTLLFVLIKFGDYNRIHIKLYNINNVILVELLKRH